MIIQGLKRLSTTLPSQKETTYLFINSLLTGQNFFVFCEGTTAAGIPLNDEKFGMLYGNHITRQIRKRIGVSFFTKGAYVLSKNACYADSRAPVGSYLETIYT